MDISKLPGWMLAVALLMVATGFLVSLFVLDEPKTFAGLEFGPRPPESIVSVAPKVWTPVIDRDSCDTKRTITDKSTMVECRPGYVVVGLAEHRGHSSDFNEPHEFKCCKLAAK